MLRAVWLEFCCDNNNNNCYAPLKQHPVIQSFFISLSKISNLIYQTGRGGGLGEQPPTVLIRSWLQITLSCPCSSFKQFNSSGVPFLPGRCQPSPSLCVVHGSILPVTMPYGVFVVHEELRGREPLLTVCPKGWGTDRQHRNNMQILTVCPEGGGGREGHPNS